MKENYKTVISEIKANKNPKKAKIYMRFFKTGKGEYGEGDLFLGLTVPQTRQIAKRYKNISLTNVQKLLKNKYHEVRLCALVILVLKFSSKKTIGGQKQIYNFYLKNTKYINNWDLVDISCDKIVGSYLYKTKNITPLKKLAKSKNLWERRIAIVSVFAFIKQKDCNKALTISKILINDKHDLIHKAVGWMLREVGKNCGQSVLEKFLKQHLYKLPRTTLRYAIEKFGKQKRQLYLNGKIIKQQKVS